MRNSYVAPVVTGLLFAFSYAFLLSKQWETSQCYKTISGIHQNLISTVPDYQSINLRDGFIYSKANVTGTVYADDDFNLELPECLYAKKEVQICKRLPGILGLFSTNWESASLHKNDDMIKNNWKIFKERYYWDNLKFGAYDIDIKLLKNAYFNMNFVPSKNDLKKFKTSRAGELMSFEDDGWFHLRNRRKGLSTIHIQIIDFGQFDIFFQIIIQLFKYFIPMTLNDGNDFDGSCVEGDIRVKFSYGASATNNVISTIAWKNGSTLTTYRINEKDYGTIVSNDVLQNQIPLGKCTDRNKGSLKFVTLVFTIIAGFCCFNNYLKRTMFYVVVGIVNSLICYGLKLAKGPYKM